MIKNEHGVYCARKKVPAQLQEAVAALLGGNKHKQTWLQKSLGTKELREANVRAKPVLMEFDAILARAGETLKQQPLRASLAPAEIARMAEYHYAWTLTNHDYGLQHGPSMEAETREFNRQFAVEDGQELLVWNEPIPKYGFSGGQMADLADFLARRSLKPKQPSLEVTSHTLIGKLNTRSRRFKSIWIGKALLTGS